MTDTQATQTMYTKPLAMTGTGILALALLTGCTTAGPEAGSTPAGDGGATTAPAQTSPAQSSPAGDDDAEGAGIGTAAPGDDRGGTGTSPSAGKDPVHAAIEAIHAQHPQAVIVQVDRDDNGTTFEIEAHEAGTIREFDVTADGTVREDDGTDQDDDHVRAAREATVTAEQAAEAALEGRAGQGIDEMELDEEDGALVWKVELDRENGDNGDEVRVDATTGEVRTG